VRTKVSFSAALLSIGLVILTAVPPAAATTGQVHEFPAPDDSWGITTGPDGNLWFTEFSNNKIGRITPSGTVTEFSGISTGGLFYADIAAGPDGNV
jgi:virginiamycin B lyase